MQQPIFATSYTNPQNFDYSMKRKNLACITKVIEYTLACCTWFLSNDEMKPYHGRSCLSHNCQKQYIQQDFFIFIWYHFRLSKKWCRLTTPTILNIYRLIATFFDEEYITRIQPHNPLSHSPSWSNLIHAQPNYSINLQSWLVSDLIYIYALILA